MTSPSDHYDVNSPSEDTSASSLSIQQHGELLELDTNKQDGILDIFSDFGQIEPTNSGATFTENIFDLGESTQTTGSNPVAEDPFGLDLFGVTTSSSDKIDTRLNDDNNWFKVDDSKTEKGETDDLLGLFDNLPGDKFSGIKQSDPGDLTTLEIDYDKDYLGGIQSMMDVIPLTAALSDKGKTETQPHQMRDEQNTNLLMPVDFQTNFHEANESNATIGHEIPNVLQPLNNNDSIQQSSETCVNLVDDDETASFDISSNNVEVEAFDGVGNAFMPVIDQQTYLSVATPAVESDNELISTGNKVKKIAILEDTSDHKTNVENSDVPTTDIDNMFGPDLCSKAIEVPGDTNADKAQVNFQPSNNQANNDITDFTSDVNKPESTEKADSIMTLLGEGYTSNCLPNVLEKSLPEQTDELATVDFLVQPGITGESEMDLANSEPMLDVFCVDSVNKSVLVDNMSTCDQFDSSEGIFDPSDNIMGNCVKTICSSSGDNPDTATHLNAAYSKEEVSENVQELNVFEGNADIGRHESNHNTQDYENQSVDVFAEHKVPESEILTYEANTRGSEFKTKDEIFTGDTFGLHTENSNRETPQSVTHTGDENDQVSDKNSPSFGDTSKERQHVNVFDTTVSKTDDPKEQALVSNSEPEIHLHLELHTEHDENVHIAKCIFDTGVNDESGKHTEDTSIGSELSCEEKVIEHHEKSTSQPTKEEAGEATLSNMEHVLEMPSPPAREKRKKEIVEKHMETPQLLVSTTLMETVNDNSYVNGLLDLGPKNKDVTELNTDEQDIETSADNIKMTGSVGNDAVAIHVEDNPDRLFEQPPLSTANSIFDEINTLPVTKYELLGDNLLDGATEQQDLNVNANVMNETLDIAQTNTPLVLSDGEPKIGDEISVNEIQLFSMKTNKTDNVENQCPDNQHSHHAEVFKQDTGNSLNFDDTSLLTDLPEQVDLEPEKNGEAALSNMEHVFEMPSPPPRGKKKDIVEKHMETPQLLVQTTVLETVSDNSCGSGLLDLGPINKGVTDSAKLNTDEQDIDTSADYIKMTGSAGSDADATLGEDNLERLTEQSSLSTANSIFDEINALPVTKYELLGDDMLEDATKQHDLTVNANVMNEALNIELNNTSVALFDDEPKIGDEISVNEMQLFNMKTSKTDNVEDQCPDNQQSHHAEVFMQDTEKISNFDDASLLTDVPEQVDLEPEKNGGESLSNMEHVFEMASPPPREKRKKDIVEKHMETPQLLVQTTLLETVSDNSCGSGLLDLSPINKGVTDSAKLNTDEQDIDTSADYIKMTGSAGSDADTVHGDKAERLIEQSSLSTANSFFDEINALPVTKYELLGDDMLEDTTKQHDLTVNANVMNEALNIELNNTSVALFNDEPKTEDEISVIEMHLFNMETNKTENVEDQCPENLQSHHTEVFKQETEKISNFDNASLLTDVSEQVDLEPEGNGEEEAGQATFSNMEHVFEMPSPPPREKRKKDIVEKHMETPQLLVSTTLLKTVNDNSCESGLFNLNPINKDVTDTITSNTDAQDIEISTDNMYMTVPAGNDADATLGEDNMEHLTEQSSLSTANSIFDEINALPVTKYELLGDNLLEDTTEQHDLTVNANVMNEALGIEQNKTSVGLFDNKIKIEDVIPVNEMQLPNIKTNKTENVEDQYPENLQSHHAEVFQQDTENSLNFDNKSLSNDVLEQVDLEPEKNGEEEAGDATLSNMEHVFEMPSPPAREKRKKDIAEKLMETTQLLVSATSLETVHDNSCVNGLLDLNQKNEDVPDTTDMNTDEQDIDNTNTIGSAGSDTHSTLENNAERPIEQSYLSTANSIFDEINALPVTKYELLGDDMLEDTTKQHDLTVNANVMNEALGIEQTTSSKGLVDNKSNIGDKMPVNEMQLSNMEVNKTENLTNFDHFGNDNNTLPDFDDNSLLIIAHEPMNDQPEHSTSEDKKGSSSLENDIKKEIFAFKNKNEETPSKSVSEYEIGVLLNTSASAEDCKAPYFSDADISHNNQVADIKATELLTIEVETSKEDALLFELAGTKDTSDSSALPKDSAPEQLFQNIDPILPVLSTETQQTNQISAFSVFDTEDFASVKSNPFITHGEGSSSNMLEIAGADSHPANETSTKRFQKTVSDEFVTQCQDLVPPVEFANLFGSEVASKNPELQLLENTNYLTGGADINDIFDKQTSSAEENIELHTIQELKTDTTGSLSLAISLNDKNKLVGSFVSSDDEEMPKLDKPDDQLFNNITPESQEALGDASILVAQSSPDETKFTDLTPGVLNSDEKTASEIQVKKQASQHFINDDMLSGQFMETIVTEDSESQLEYEIEDNYSMIESTGTVHVSISHNENEEFQKTEEVPNVLKLNTSEETINKDSVHVYDFPDDKQIESIAPTAPKRKKKKVSLHALLPVDENISTEADIIPSSTCAHQEQQNTQDSGESLQEENVPQNSSETMLVIKPDDECSATVQQDNVLEHSEKDPILGIELNQQPIDTVSGISEYETGEEESQSNLEMNFGQVNNTCTMAQNNSESHNGQDTSLSHGVDLIGEDPNVFQEIPTTITDKHIGHTYPSDTSNETLGNQINLSVKNEDKLNELESNTKLKNDLHCMSNSEDQIDVTDDVNSSHSGKNENNDDERASSSSDEGSMFGSDQMNISDLDETFCDENQTGDNISQISLEFDDNPFASSQLAPQRGKKNVVVSVPYVRVDDHAKRNVVPSTVFVNPEDFGEENDLAPGDYIDLTQVSNAAFMHESLIPQANGLTVISTASEGNFVSFDSDWDEFQQDMQPVNTLPVIEEESEPEEVDDEEWEPLKQHSVSSDDDTEVTEAALVKTSEEITDKNLQEDFASSNLDSGDKQFASSESELEIESDANSTTTEDSWCILERPSETEDSDLNEHSADLFMPNAAISSVNLQEKVLDSHNAWNDHSLNDVIVDETVVSMAADNIEPCADNVLPQSNDINHKNQTEIELGGNEALSRPVEEVTKELTTTDINTNLDPHAETLEISVLEIPQDSDSGHDSPTLGMIFNKTLSEETGEIVQVGLSNALGEEEAQALVVSDVGNGNLSYENTEISDVGQHITMDDNESKLEEVTTINLSNFKDDSHSFVDDSKMNILENVSCEETNITHEHKILQEKEEIKTTEENHETKPSTEEVFDELQTLPTNNLAKDTEETVDIDKVFDSKQLSNNDELPDNIFNDNQMELTDPGRSGNKEHEQLLNGNFDEDVVFGLVKPCINNKESDEAALHTVVTSKNDHGTKDMIGNVEKFHKQQEEVDIFSTVDNSGIKKEKKSGEFQLPDHSLLDISSESIDFSSQVITAESNKLGAHHTASDHTDEELVQISNKPLKKLHVQDDEADNDSDGQTFQQNRVRYDTIGSIDLLTDSEEEEEITEEPTKPSNEELISIDLKTDTDKEEESVTSSQSGSLRRRSIAPPSSLVLSIALDEVKVQTPTPDVVLESESGTPSASEISNASSATNKSAKESDPDILTPSVPSNLKEPPLWETVVVGNVDYRIDGRAIQNYKRVISHGGFYKEKSAIVEIFGRYLPDSSVPNYTWVMDNLFLYLVATLEMLVQNQEYVVVFFNGSVSKNHFPSTAWLKKSHQQIPYHLRKNLKEFYVIQSSFYFKTLTGLARMFLSRKAFKKTKNVKSHKELKQFIPTDFLFIPQDIASTTPNKMNQQVNKGWQWWWTR